MPRTFKLSNRRWAILFAISFFGFGFSLVGESASILHTLLALLELPLHKYVYIQQSLSYISAVTVFPTAWFIDRFGTRLTMYIAAVLTMVADAAYALLYNPSLIYWKEMRRTYWITAKVVSNQISTIFYCLPLKISENWFASSERSVAWTVMMSSINVGISVAAYSYPRFIHQVDDVKPLFYLNTGFGFTTTLVILCCITRSKPKHPPNERATTPTTPAKCLGSIKIIFKQKDMMIHLVHEAIFEGIYISVLAVIQDILTSVGHTEIFVGNLISISALISVVMIISSSYFVHRINNIILTCKIASILRAIVFVAYLGTMLYPLQGWVVILSSIAFSLIKSWTPPNFTSMTATLASGIVPEAAISGFAIALTMISITASQVVFVLLIGTSEKGKPDYTYSMAFVIAVCMLNTFVYLIFFQGKTRKERQQLQSNVESSAP